MEWGGGAIGWQASSTQYQTHSLSGTNSDDIGCYYSNSYSAIVYKLACECACGCFILSLIQFTYIFIRHSCIALPL